MLSIFGNGAGRGYEEIGNGQLKELRENENEYLSNGEIREFLNEFRDSMPSFLIRELENALAGKNITRAQLVRIMEKVVSSYLDRDAGIKKSVAELSDKLADVQREISEVKMYTNEIKHIMEEIAELKKEMMEIKETMDNMIKDLRLLCNYDMDLNSFIDEVLRGCENGERDKGDNQN